MLTGAASFDSVKIEWLDGAYLVIAGDSRLGAETRTAVGNFAGISITGADAGDNKAPSIAFHAEPGGLFQPLRIFENTDYELEVRLPLSRTEALCELGACSGMRWPFRNRRLHRFLKVTPPSLWVEDEHGGIRIGAFLASREYLGTVDLTIWTDEHSLSFEVQSRKIGYESEYMRLVEDISEYHLGLLHEVGSATGLALALSAKPNRELQSDYFQMRRLMQPDRLPDAIGRILLNPASNLLIEEISVPIGQTKSMASSKIGQRQTGMGFAHGGPLAGLFRGFTPTLVPVTKKRESLDTNENRYVKSFLEDLLALLVQLESAAAKDKRAGMVCEMAEWKDQVLGWSAADLWREVGPLRYGATNSQKMQRAPGYRDVLQADIELSEALRLPIAGLDERDGSLLLGDVKPVHTLYGYWCYFVVREALTCLYGPDLSKGAGLVARSASGLSITLGTRQEASRASWKIEDNGISANVHLFFSRQFAPKPEPEWGEWYGSYSMSFDPDISIAVQVGDATHWLSFDAKYRADKIDRGENGLVETDGEMTQEDMSDAHAYRFKKEDLNKMHTYRDAILGTRGAYILYPGNEASPVSNLFVRKPPVPNELLSFPSVGAFALRPGQAESQSICLQGFIAQALGTILRGGGYREELAFEN